MVPLFEKEKKRVYNKYLDSEASGFLSPIPQHLRPTKKPLSQRATDCLTLLSTVIESGDNTTSCLLFIITDCAKSFDQTPLLSVK